MTALATLPLVVTVVLIELAVGGIFLIWLLDRRGEAPDGFIRLTAAVNLFAALFAVLLIPTIPRGELAQRAGLASDPLGAYAQGIILVAILCAVHLLTTFIPSRDVRGVVSLLGIIGGVGTLVAAAIARPVASPDASYDVFAIVSLPISALALGGVNAAMLLGHWYLVTPKLSTAPLRRAAFTIVIAVALQLGLVGVAFARGDLQTTLQGALMVAAALRIGIGILMTGGVALAAWWTASMNTQSSTGLLYVGLGTVLAGEVSARVIFFIAGVPI